MVNQIKRSYLYHIVYVIFLKKAFNPSLSPTDSPHHNLIPIKQGVTLIKICVVVISVKSNVAIILPSSLNSDKPHTCIDKRQKYQIET